MKIQAAVVGAALVVGCGAGNTEAPPSAREEKPAEPPSAREEKLAEPPASEVSGDTETREPPSAEPRRIKQITVERPTPKAPSEDGSFSGGHITWMVNEHLDAIVACYKTAFKDSPGVAGRILYDWTVTSDGSVTGVRVRETTMNHQPLETCIADIIRSWHFSPAPVKEAVITYPFLFREQ